MENKTMKKKRIMSIILAVAMVFVFMPAETAFAANHTIVIAPTASVNDIRTAIQTKIDGAVQGDTVTVTGEKADVSQELYLTIPKGIKVVWKADYRGNAALGNPLISLNGTDENNMGIFEVAGGAYLDHVQPAQTITAYNINVLVSGGTVKMSSWGSAISHQGYGNITVSGGTIEAGGGDAIHAYESCYGDVSISGGTVTSELRAIIIGENNLSMTGGLVKSTGDDGSAIETSSGFDENHSITISSGTVQATGDQGSAIRNNYDGNITISGNPTITGCLGIINDGLGTVAISGGTVTGTGDGGYAVMNRTEYGKIIVSGGTLTATGGIDGGGFPACTIGSSGGTICVSGGTIKATGTKGQALWVNKYGIAAFLKNTCPVGAFFVDNGELNNISGNEGMIVEVDSFNISKNLFGSTGITKKAGNQTAIWDMTGTKPKIKFTLADNSTKFMEWGSYEVERDSTTKALKKPVIKSIKVGKKKMTVTWKKAANSQGITKYKIQYREKGKTKWKTKTVSATKSKLVIKKLKKGKKYQIRMKIYKVKPGVTYNKAWSKVKTSKKIK